MGATLTVGYGSRFGGAVAEVARSSQNQIGKADAQGGAARYSRWFFSEDGPEPLATASKNFKEIAPRMAAAEVAAATKDNMAILGNEACDLFMSRLPKDHKMRKAIRSSVLAQTPYLGSCKFGEVLAARNADTYSVMQIFIANFEGELNTTAGATFVVPTRLDYDQMFYGVHVIVDKIGNPIDFDRARGRNGIAFKTKDLTTALYSIASASTGLSLEALRARASAKQRARLLPFPSAYCGGMVLIERYGTMRIFWDKTGNSLRMTSGATTFALAVLMAIPATANAPKFTSTYTDIARCPVVERGDDEFTLKCSGPDGETAILQYVEGRVGLFFKPELNGEAGADDLFEIKPSAKKVFSGKLEWRAAAGENRPCAAIIRVPVANGDPLLVFDLSSGTVVGQVADNKTAQRVADEICESQVSHASAKTEPVNEQNADGVAQGISQGEQDFDATYKRNGIAGVQELVAQCYMSASEAGQIARCAQMDLLASINDKIFAERYGMPRYAYFRGNNPKSRMGEAIRRLKFTATEVAELNKIFE